MFGTAIAGAIIKAGFSAVLGWLTSLWDRFVQKQANIEQGRREVLDVVRTETEKLKDEIREIRDTPVTVDDAFDELLKRAEGSSGKDVVSEPTPSSGISGEGAAKGQSSQSPDGTVDDKVEKPLS